MRLIRSFVPGLLLLAAGLTAAGCKDEGAADGAGGAGGADGGGGASSGSMYAIMYKLEDDSGETSYLTTFDSMDRAEISTATSREFPGGEASMLSYRGWVFVGAPSSPEIIRYTVKADGSLTDEKRLSFANYGFSVIYMDSWGTSFIDENKAYLFDSQSGTHVIWNPTTMKITGEIEAIDGYLHDGYSTETSGAIVRDGKLFRDFYHFDWDGFRMETAHTLAVFDTKTDKLLETHDETRCPGPASRAQIDEAGNIYFSNAAWNAALTLMYDAPKNCILRVPVGATNFDADWSLVYSELEGGKEGAIFTYLGDGQGIVALFDDKKTSFDDATDPYDYYEGPYWDLYRIDLETRELTPITGIPSNPGDYTPALFGDRTFLMVPQEGWVEMDLFELKGAKAEARFDLPGWSFSITQLR